MTPETPATAPVAAAPTEGPTDGGAALTMPPDQAMELPIGPMEPISVTGRAPVAATRDEALTMEDRTIDAGSSTPKDRDVAGTGELVAPFDLVTGEAAVPTNTNVTTCDHMTASNPHHACLP